MKKAAAISLQPGWARETEKSGTARQQSSAESGQDSTQGIAESHEVFGKNLLFQSEVSDGKVVTEVFDGGRLLTCRKEPVDPKAGTRTRRIRIGKIHQGILLEALERSKQSQKKEEGAVATERPGGELLAFPGSASESSSRPTDSRWTAADADLLEQLEAIEGFMGAALVDCKSGEVSVARGGLDMTPAAPAVVEVVQAQRKASRELEEGRLDDILMTTQSQYHLIRPLEGRTEVHLVLVLDRSVANLAMSRRALRSFGAGGD